MTPCDPPPADANSKAPPHDLEAEASVLGSMLLDGGVIDPVARILRPKDFYRESHRRIFESACALRESGRGVDAVLLREELRRRGDLNVAGGSEAIMDLLDRVPTTAHALQYAAIVRETADRRELLRISGQVQHMALNGSTAAEAVAATRARLDTMDADSLSDAVPFAAIEAKATSWLWPGRIPYGAITVIDGDPGLGKTTLLLDLAGRLSTGKPMPDGSGGGVPAGVLIASAEDDASGTVRPRLEAAGADLSRIFSPGTLVPTIPGALPVLERMVVKNKIRLIGWDPVVPFLSPELDAWSDQQMRRALVPLRSMVERTGAAAVLIRHLNKSSGGNPLYRGGGSIGITGAARAVLLVGEHPDEEGHRVLAVTKLNLGRKAGALAFRLEEVEVAGAEPTSRVVWLEASSLRAGDLLGPASSRSATKTRRLLAAQDRVLAALRRAPSPMARDGVALAARGSIAEDIQALKALVASGAVVQSGDGRRGKPFRYGIPTSPPSHPVSIPSQTGKTGSRQRTPSPRPSVLGHGDGQTGLSPAERSETGSSS